MAFSAVFALLLYSKEAVLYVIFLYTNLMHIVSVRVNHVA